LHHFAGLRLKMRRFAISTVLLAVHLIIMLVAVDRLANFSMRGHGIVAGEATLIGVALGVGRLHKAGRLVVGAVGLAVLVTLLISLSLRLPLGGLFGMNGMGWPFLLLVVRSLIVASYYWMKFGRQGIALATTGEPLEGSLLRLPLKFFFTATMLVALFLAIQNNLDNAFYGLLLVVLIVLLGVGYAAMSLLASLLPLEPNPTPSRIAVYLLTTLTIAFALAGHQYQQTAGPSPWPHGWAHFRRGLTPCLIEITWVWCTLLVVRLAGYRLAKTCSGCQI
jgi:hypothetical protein